MTPAALLSLWLAVAPTASDDDRAQASALADKAETLWAEQDLDGARDALARAYQLDPNPFFLFGRGRLAAEAEDCDEAVALMREFLERYPGADGSEDARSMIRACGETETPEVQREPEPPPPAAAPPQPEPTDHPPTRSWHRDPAAGVLVGSGAVGVAAGVGLYVGAVVERNGAEEAPTTDAYRDSVERARGLRTGGLILASVGGALVVGGIARYVIVARRGRSQARFGRGLLTLRF